MAHEKKPAVVVEKSGGKVRVRGLGWPLPVTLDTEERGRISVTIQPNTWTKVPDEIYRFLQSRYGESRYTLIPDVEANEDRPHRPGEQPVMKKEEVDPAYYMEFKD